MTRGTDWSEVSTQTIGHYAVHAERYRDGTLDHDVEQNIDALLDAIEGTPPFEILDLGCGPGRDLKRFVERGQRAVGLDGAPPFVEMARAYSGCEVWQQDFLDLGLPTGRFDGVFANATLFHVPSAALPDVLLRLRACLKPRGVLFASNPRGDNREGWNGVRYGAYYDLECWQAIVAAAGFEEIHHYFRPPGLPREQQPWLASVWRKRA